MKPPPEILYEPDWSAIFAALAFALSLFTLWYSAFRRGRLSISTSRWTALGLEASGKPAAAFVVKIDVINTGGRPILLKDLFLEATTRHGAKIYYEPIMLFDLTDYFGSLGQDRRIATAQKGMVPLPIRVPSGKQLDFGAEMLFLPHDKKTAVRVADDFPILLRLFASTERTNGYAQITTQIVTAEDVASLTNGSLAGVLSSTSIEQRDDFLNKRQRSNGESNTSR